MTSPPSAAFCRRCRRSSDDDDLRPVPLPFRALAGLALGAVHAGMWLWEDLGQNYCPSCRRWLSFLTVVLAMLVAGIAAYGVLWASRAGLFEIWRRSRG